MKAMISFPEEAFTPYGAMVKTCLCILRKFDLNEKFNGSSKAFLCSVENLGYDATGRVKTGNEVEKVVTAFFEKVGW